jgi:hypothetical protein
LVEHLAGFRRGALLLPNVYLETRNSELLPCLLLSEALYVGDFDSVRPSELLLCGQRALLPAILR